MAPSILLTGATGYIGGSVLHTLVSEHPEYDITVLLRKEPQGFAHKYPNVKKVFGDYDNAQVLSDAASRANVVVHNGESDHEPSIKALIAGLLERREASYLIHLGGTRVISDWHSERYVGELNPRIWSDIDDIEEIWSLPDKAAHRNVDKIIQGAWQKHGDKLKTAIVCPPDIYGKGHGPVRDESVLLPAFCKESLNVGASFYTGSGSNTRSWVHIDDLMALYQRLVEAAVAGGDNAEWGKGGYYFAASQEVSQIDFAKAVGRILKSHKAIESQDPIQLSLAHIDAMMQHLGFPHIGVYAFAANARSHADRATKYLGYKPVAPSLWETLETDLSICLDRSHKTTQTAQSRLIT